MPFYVSSILLVFFRFLVLRVELGERDFGIELPMKFQVPFSMSPRVGWLFGLLFEGVKWFANKNKEEL